MRKMIKAFGLAAIAAVVLIGKPALATDSGLSTSNDFVCAFAQSIINTVPVDAKGPVKSALVLVTGCSNLTI